MKIKVFAIALLLIFFILTLFTALKTSGTCDEIAHHIPAGYVLLTKGDFKMATDSPPLARYIIALPLKLFMKINMPNNKSDWRRDDRGSYGRDFFYKYNSESRKMLFLSRIPVMLIGVLCGLILFIWSSALYGRKAGLLSLFLYALSPNILAHSALATADMVVTFFIFLSAYSFWLFLKDPSFKKIVFAGASIGLAQLSKYNAVLLYPAFLLVLFFEMSSIDKPKRFDIFLKFFIIIFISLIVLWAGYGFDLQPVLKDAMRAGEKIETACAVASRLSPYAGSINVEKLLLNTPAPLGSHILGMLGVFRHVHDSQRTFFMGSWSDRGNPLYFLTAFLIKNPIPFIIFLISGTLISLKNKLGGAERIILITISLFFITSSMGNLQIGLRHILPLFPFCFMIAGRSVVVFNKNRFFNLAILSLMMWYVISAALTWPNYLGYFNESIGGPKNGYKYLRDSNLDWGQDLPALADYMKKNHVKEVALEYFGQADPADYGVVYRKLEPKELERPGSDIYAISAQYLEHVKWAGDYDPTETAGYSIHIYDLTGKGKK